MDRPAATAATAREIILEIVRNMRDGLEPLHYSTLAPSIYHVYLHPDDMERLRGIAPRIVDEARRALDEELASLNRTGLAERLKLVHRTAPKVAAPEGGTHIGEHRRCFFIGKRAEKKSLRRRGDGQEQTEGAGGSHSFSTRRGAEKTR